jgi:copper(I)-binding protein
VPDTKAVLLLTGLKTRLWPGMTISVTFTFDRAGTVTVQVPVQLSKTPQTSVIPAPSTTGQPG